MNTPPSIEARGLSLAYGAVQAVQQVSFSLPPGRTTGLLGPNGAGKTSLVRMLLGLQAPGSGQAFVMGHAAGSAPARARLGAMVQDAQLPDALKVHEVLTLLSCAYPQPLPLAEALALLQLQDLAGRRCDALSAGQKRRVQCAAAICGDPPVLLLDEPSAHMDAQSKEALWALIERWRRRGKSILLVSHQWDEVEALVDGVLVMAQGRLLAQSDAAAMRRWVGGARVSFEADLPLQELRALPGVSLCVQKGRRWELLVDDANRFIGLLGRWPQPVAGLSVSPPTIEDALRLLMASGPAAADDMQREARSMP